MNFIRKLFTSPEVSDLISSLTAISEAERTVSFQEKQVYSLQFLEFINESNPQLHDILSSLFDVGKTIPSTFDNSIPERANIPPKLTPIKEKQAAFNKLRKQKSSLEAKVSACRKNYKEIKNKLQKLIEEKAPQNEISKATLQLKRAESDQKGALFIYLEFNKTFDKEELIYTKEIYNLLIDPLKEWAESESKQFNELFKKSSDYLSVAENINCNIEPDPQLQQLLQNLNGELGE